MLTLSTRKKLKVNLLEGVYFHVLVVLYLSATEGARQGARFVVLLPLEQTFRTQEMCTGLELHVFVVLLADLSGGFISSFVMWGQLLKLANLKIN